MSSEEYAEIKFKISQKKISAITIDTTTFDDNGMRLDRGMFSQLKQFNRHPANLVIAEVVFREIGRHLTKSITTKKERFGRDMSDAADFVGFDQQYIDEINTKFSELPSPQEICNLQIDSFLANSGALVLEADDYVNVSDLLGSYFGNEPPFQKENNKKSEFPDAISLKTLENWALDEDTEIVVVSRDSDWISYCEKSDRLHHVKDLATALALFQTPDEAVRHMIQNLQRDLNDKSSILFLRIEEEIKSYDWSEAITSDAYSQFEYEEDEFYVEVNECIFADVPNAIKVTDIDQEEVSVMIILQVQGTFVGRYSFQKWDGVDKEYISMGSSQITDNFDESVSIVLRIPNKSNDVDDIEFEIEPNTVHFEFGEIEPDWMSGRENID